MRFTLLCCLLLGLGCSDGGGMGTGGTGAGACPSATDGSYDRVVISETVPPGCGPAAAIPPYPLFLAGAASDAPSLSLQGAPGFGCRTTRDGCSLSLVCEGRTDTGAPASIFGTYRFEGAAFSGEESWMPSDVPQGCRTRAVIVGAVP